MYIVLQEDVCDTRVFANYVFTTKNDAFNYVYDNMDKKATEVNIVTKDGIYTHTFNPNVNYNDIITYTVKKLEVYNKDEKWKK